MQESVRSYQTKWASCTCPHLVCNNYAIFFATAQLGAELLIPLLPWFQEDLKNLHVDQGYHMNAKGMVLCLLLVTVTVL